MNRSQPFRRLGALALITIVALPATACSDRRDAAAAPAGDAAPQPKTIDGAKAAAQNVFDRFSGGDFAGAWDLYTTAGQRAISRSDYVRLNTVCARTGLPIQLTSARMESAGRAVVIAEQLTAAQSYTMVYEAGSWRLEPARSGLYTQGAEHAIAAHKKAGACADA
jgi:hypothetical protein